MLDQSFSAENFRKILEIENRKGIYLEGEFYPDIKALSDKIKKVNSDLRLLKTKGLSSKKYQATKDKLNDKKKQLKDKREDKLLEKLRLVSSTVTSDSFRLKLQVNTTITAKPVYRTSYRLENILALKQLQYNFRKLYKVKQSDRYSLVSQIRSILDDGFPKVVLKTDIKDFYESIPHDRLLEKLSEENLLTYLSQRLIQQILVEYKNTLPKKTTGVPRGIGISPYLVELYMRDIDSKIKSLPDVMYYSRYVDDIIVVFMPPVDTTVRDYRGEVKAILAKKGLTMNEDPQKTSLIDLSQKGRKLRYKVEYLGYRFISGYEKGKHVPLIVAFSEKKKKRYAQRLLKAFELYRTHSRRNEKQARKLFVRRMRFLMTNTKLVNNKRNVLTGIYYSNNLINTTRDLLILDRYFKVLAKRFGLPTQLEKRITSKYSFESGFSPSCMSKFGASELSGIMKGWSR